jgi:plastocyanin
MRRWPILGLLVLLSAAACGGNNKVGNSALLNIKEKAAGGFDVTTTTVPSGTLPPAATTPPTTRPTATTSPPRTTSTLTPAQQKAITAVIKIEGSGTSAFVPSLQTVYPGTPVQWVNTDNVARAVVADDGTSFSSGPIAPGGSFTWKASGTPRRIDYHDGTRPYAVAALELVPSP